MSKQFLQIDVTKPNFDSRKSDLIEIRLNNNDLIEVNFSKLVIQSKYIRDKYKYSEALSMMQKEIDEISEQMKIDSESIKLFIQLIQEEKVNIPLEHYKNFYTLSEYFDIPIFINQLDKISQQHLFKDLNFTIQFFQNCKSNDNINHETKLTSKIEIYLSTRINECFQNPKFSELPITTISCIIEKSDKEMIDQNLLVDFILKSIENRFTLLIFVELHKLKDDQIENFFNFIENQQENQQEIYLQYLSFNLLFIKKMKNEINQTKEELKKTRFNFERSEEEHEKTKQTLALTKKELKKERIDFERLKEEHEKTKQTLALAETELKKARTDFERSEEGHKKTKQTLASTEEELKKAKIKLEQTKTELNRIKIKYLLPSIVTVCGYDKYNQLGKSPNNIIKESISPPIQIQLDSSPLLSFSVYGWHSVMVTSDGLLKGIGHNMNGRITSSLPKEDIDHFTEFSIKDSNGRQLDPLSAVCTAYGTLYMFSKIDENGKQLVLCDQDINLGDPVFLDIGNQDPVALFGGRCYLSAINNDGEIIFINRNSVKKSPEARIASVSLPDGEKASSVACCDNSIVVLSSNGRVFESSIENSSSVLKFSEVKELECKEIVCVSGTYNHILAVTKEGRVFGRGSNEDGKLGIGKEIESTSSFTEISILNKHEIKSAYAGGLHSLFVTSEGKILSCGYNYSGELLHKNGPGENIYLPTETTITNGARFCITGWCLEVIFIKNDPPPNTPNMRIK